MNWWAAGGLVLLLLLAAGLRLGSLRFDYGHPDEVISITVAERVVGSGSLDTNWELADLPPLFKQPQYNFSGYLLSSAAVLQMKEWWPGAGTSSSLRWLRAWSALLGIAVVALTFLAGRQFFGAATGWCAALLVCFFPLLYQDSLYARPETFVTALTLAAIGLVAAERSLFRGAGFCAAFLLGVLIATKVSMVLLVPLLLLVPGLPQPTRDLTSWGPPSHRPWRHAWNWGKWLALAMLLGFLAGVPHAVAHIGDYFEGIRFLRRQYGTGHWPHGLVDADVVDRIAYAGRYFHATAGWLMLLAFAGAAVAAVRRQQRALFVFLIALATVVQFSVYPTFFERNLSHVIPVFMIFAAYGLVSLGAVATKPMARTALTAALLLVALAPALHTTLTLRFDELPGKPGKRLDALRASLEKQLGLPSVRVRWTEHENDVREAMAYRCDSPMLVELRSGEDGRSAQLRHALAARDGLVEVARHASNFSHVPSSTLHVYFTPTTVFLHRPRGVASCHKADGGLVAAESAGDVLPLLATESEGGWTMAGADRVSQDAYGSADFYGSWSGADARRGRLRMTVSVADSEYLVLPYLSGPAVHRQTIRITDAQTSAVILDGKLQLSLAWRFPFMRLPPATRAVTIEAVDDGNGWGEWHALGRPRALKKD